MLTGPEGEFAFHGVPAGHVQIEYTKPGYFRPSTGGVAQHLGRVFSRGVEVGPDTEKIVLKLFPEAIISGRVVGQDEEPLEGATVEVMTYVWEEGRRILSMMRGVNTDEDGDFRVGGLASGQYILAVKSGGVARRVLGQQAPKSPVSYPGIIYYPGTPDLPSAVPIDLVPGQKMDARFSLSLQPAYNLAGKVVVSGEWKQVNGPTIIDSQDQPLFGVNRFDQSTGAFEFPAVPAGTYTIRVQGSDTRNYGRVTDQKVTVSQSVTNLQLSLRPGINIPLLARHEFSKAQPQGGSCDWQDHDGHQHHSDCSDYPAARVDLISIDSRARFSSNFQPPQDQADSVVAGVVPGKYIVRAQPAFGGYVQSLRSGELDLLREPLTVPEDGNVQPIEVLVRDDSGTLRVAVHSDKAGMSVVVVLREGDLGSPTRLIYMLNNRSSSYVINGRLAGPGEAYFAPLAPGDYKVLAVDSLDSLDGRSFDDPEFLAKYASRAASVTVTANGTAAITVDVIHNGE
jgi:hypothetical protein